MGTYTQLEIAGYAVLSTKSSVDPTIMTIFRESDRRNFIRKNCDRNPMVYSIDETDDGTEAATIYTCPSSHVIDRLNIMGFTIERARNEFDRLLLNERDARQEWEGSSDADDYRNLKFLSSLNFDLYCSALRGIIARRERADPFQDKLRFPSESIEHYILSDDEGIFGFFCRDIRFFIRAVCEIVPQDSYVTQDITDLVDGGYYTDAEAVCASSINSLVDTHTENASIIILTEGSSDSGILGHSMKLLYPHLYDYYRFLDFDNTKSPGGASHLVNLLKAFAGVGIANKIVAVFDNDAAAFDERRKLSSISLPSNIAVINYPDYGELRSYPTKGPTGLSEIDINGLAASIELYLGRDVLSTDGTLTPVQWRGFMDGVGRYQGEIMRKSEIQSRFHRKLNRAASDPDFFESCDWAGLRLVLTGIFKAFE